MMEFFDEKMRLGMKSVYVSSLEKLLQYEQDLRNLNPPEIIGYKPAVGRRLLGRAIFGLYEGLCSIGEREEAEFTIAKYRQGKTLVPSLS